MASKQHRDELNRTLDPYAAAMPDGLRDLVSSAAMKREAEMAADGLTEAGRTMRARLQLAAQGIPCDAEQEARWKRLGLID